MELSVLAWVSMALFGTGLVLFSIALLWNSEQNHTRIVDMVLTCGKTFASTVLECGKIVATKFKQLRTTAIIFGVLLTVIILAMMNNEQLMKGGEKIPNAFWIAFGVVLSAFATAIAKLVEGEDAKDKKDSD